MVFLSIHRNIIQIAQKWIASYFSKHKNSFSKIFGAGILIVAFNFYIQELYNIGFDFNWSTYQFNWYYLACVVILHAIGLAYGSLGWAMIMQNLDNQARLIDSVKIYYVTTITRNLPGLVVHFAGRTYLHKKNGQNKTISVVSITLEMLIATLASILTYLIFWPFSGLPPIIPQYYTILILTVICCLTFSPLFKHLISWQNCQATQTIQTNYIHLLNLHLMYFLIIVLGGIILFLTIKIIYPISPVYLPASIGVAGFSMAVLLLTFWIPGSFRLRDMTLLIMLSDFTNPAIALMITLLWRYLLIISDLFWGVFALFLMWMNNDRIWQEIQVNVLWPRHLKNISKFIPKDYYDRDKA